jgi:hypothetical protein
MSFLNLVDRKLLKKQGFPKPVDLSEKLMMSLSDKQKQILFNLSDLHDKAEGLVKKINACKPTPSGILGFSDGAVTVCETEDDWKIITLKERQELKEVQKEMAALLDKALDLGMGGLGIIQKNCAAFKVKP